MPARRRRTYSPSAGALPARPSSGLHTAYFLPPLTPEAGPLRVSSRLTVEADRPSWTAIARTPSPARCRSAISSRSSRHRNRPVGGGFLRGIRPPVAWRQWRPVRRSTPTASQAAINVEPRAIHTQNSSCLSISSFFDHTLNTSHQDGCCDDRLNSPSLCGVTPSLARICYRKREWIIVLHATRRFHTVWRPQGHVGGREHQSVLKAKLSMTGETAAIRPRTGRSPTVSVTPG